MIILKKMVQKKKFPKSLLPASVGWLSPAFQSNSAKIDP